MSEVALTELSTERCFPYMPYETLFEIFRRLPKGKLIKISRLCSWFRVVAGDTRLWKDVYIDYEQKNKQRYEVIAFEELYSEPWPVDVIDITDRQINSPVSSNIGQIVKVNKLRLSAIKADNVALEAILAKYQCTELYLNSNVFGHGHIMGTKPEAFSKQPGLEVLSLGGINPQAGEPRAQFRLWLAQVLSNCKNLKTLDLSSDILTTREMLDSVKNLPESLENLIIRNVLAGDSFLGLLAESTPNLKELEVTVSDLKSILTSPSLLKLQCLESLRILSHGPHHQYITEHFMHIIKLPALKTVYILALYEHQLEILETRFEKFRPMLEPHGITVKVIEEPKWSVPLDGSLWEVS